MSEILKLIKNIELNTKSPINIFDLFEIKSLKNYTGVELKSDILFEYSKDFKFIDIVEFLKLIKNQFDINEEELIYELKYIIRNTSNYF
jgi:hypothetical protein